MDRLLAEERWHPHPHGVDSWFDVIENELSVRIGQRTLERWPAIVGREADDDSGQRSAGLVFAGLIEHPPHNPSFIPLSRT
jgi:hypothetical protein